MLASTSSGVQLSTTQVHCAGLEPLDQERDQDVVALGRLAVEAADVVAHAQLHP